MIIVRSIKPGKPFQSSIFREEMLTAAKQTRDDVLDDFKRTVQTWKHKPKFSTKIDMGAAVGGIRVQVATDDAAYGYVDEGTKKRYAVMSPDWKSKTEPNVIQSFPGKGKAVFIPGKRRSKRRTGRKMKPLPGIKARNFTKIIAKTRKPELQRTAKNALARAARRSGYGVA